jgi:hypothetical protein
MFRSYQKKDSRVVRVFARADSELRGLLREYTAR